MSKYHIKGHSIWGGLGVMGAAHPAPGVTPPTPSQVGQGPAIPTPAPYTPDPSVLQQQIQGGLNAGLSSAVLPYQTGQIAYQTGYNPDGTVNASNPYSQAALLQEHYQRSKLGTTNSYANQGQLYSGAYGRMQNENQHQYSIGSNQLQNNAGNQYFNLRLGTAQNLINSGVTPANATLADILKQLGA